MALCVDYPYKGPEARNTFLYHSLPKLITNSGASLPNLYL